MKPYCIKGNVNMTSSNLKRVISTKDHNIYIYIHTYIYMYTYICIYIYIYQTLGRYYLVCQVYIKRGSTIAHCQVWAKSIVGHTQVTLGLICFRRIRLLSIYIVVKDCRPIKYGTIFTKYEIHLGQCNRPTWVFFWIRNRLV